MFSQSDSTQSHTAADPMFALLTRRIVTGGLAVIAGLVGSQLVAPVEASAATEKTVSDGNFGPSQLTLKGKWATRTTPANLSKQSALLASTGSVELAFRSTGISWSPPRTTTPEPPSSISTE